MPHYPISDTRVRRADPRYVVDRPARLVIVDRNPFPVRLINLSRGGFRIACALSLPADSRIRIEVDGWPRLVGRVIWCDGGRIGCMFDPPPGDPLFAMMEKAVLAVEGP